MDFNNSRRRPSFVLPDPKKIKRTVLIVIVVIILAALALTSWYIVDEKQQAVVTTFGKVTKVTDAGVHFMLPFGIQQATRWM